MRLLLIFVALVTIVPSAAAEHVRLFAVALANDSAGAFMGGSSRGSGLYKSDDHGKSWKHLGWQNVKSYSMDADPTSAGRVLYLATGLGILKSEDAGAHWRQVTDWRMAEAMDVRVDPRHPDRVYVATAHGPWYSSNAGRSWRKLDAGLPVPYTCRIRIATEAEHHVYVANEQGVFVLRGERWQRVRNSPAHVRDLLELAPDVWGIATTTGVYVERGRDLSGPFPLTDAQPEAWSLARDSSSNDPSTLLAGGPAGCYRIDLSSGARSLVSAEHDVSAVLSVEGKVLVATLGDGIVSEGALPKRQIWSLRAVEVRGADASLAPDGSAGRRTSTSDETEGASVQGERGRAHLLPLSQHKTKWLERVAELRTKNFASVAARLRLGVDTTFAYQQLDTLLSSSYGDMFWMYSCAGLFYSTQDVLRPDVKARIRWCWKHYTPYRGDTENHFLMYYGSLLLMSQEWPDLPASEWFMGKSSREIYAESVQYLDQWIDETVRHGLIEFDSPRYGYYFFTPLVLLSEYTKDARLRRRFTALLEYMIADYAIEYWNGSYCGAHSRIGDASAIDPANSEITAYGDYFFRDTILHPYEDVAFAAMTSFECPKIIRDIANDKPAPFEHFEKKRGRTTLRFSDVRNVPVYKYDYMTPAYCLGSMQGGLVQPIQQQSWSLVFNSELPHNIVTGLQPNFSAEELGEFFPEYPSFMLERIGGAKAGYPSPDKWVGGSPYERIYQSKNLLVALYDIPDSARFHQIDLFLPAHLQLATTSATISPAHGEPLFENGIGYEPNRPRWTVYRYDSTLVAIRMLADYYSLPTAGGTRLRSMSGRNGYVVYLPENEHDADKLDRELNARSIDWNEHTITIPVESGREVHFALDRISQKSPYLFHSPYLESRENSAELTIRHGNEKLVLRF